MKQPNQHHAPRILGAVALIAAGMLLNLAAPAKEEKETTPAVDESQFVSIFVVPQKPGEGWDPFFPQSERIPEHKGDNQEQEQILTMDDLLLKGISGTPEKRLALINNITLAAGETTSIRAGKARLTVTCLEVGEVSALIEVGGRTRELRLRNGI